MFNDIDATTLEPVLFTLPNDNIVGVLGVQSSDSQHNNDLYSSNTLASLTPSSPPAPLSTSTARAVQYFQHVRPPSDRSVSTAAAGLTIALDLSIASTTTLGRSQVEAHSPTRQSQEPTLQLELEPYSKQEALALYSRNRAEFEIARIQGLRDARSSGTSGIVHRAHGSEEARIFPSKSSRKPRMSKHNSRDKASGGVAKLTRHHSPAAIPAKRSTNRPNWAAVRLPPLSLYTYLANNVSIVFPLGKY